MRERPILFSGPMVRAILAGRKTQTRRVVNITHRTPGLAAALLPPAGVPPRPHVARELCSYGQPGDRLWVRETWKWYGRFRGPDTSDPSGGFMYRADFAQRAFTDFPDPLARWEDFKAATLKDRRGLNEWRPSIHMPRWASRLTLEVVSVRVERLHEITEEGAQAEGVTPFPPDPEGDCWTDGKHRTAFEFLWNELHGWSPNAFAANPWVWAIEFAPLPASAVSPSGDPIEP